MAETFKKNRLSPETKRKLLAFKRHRLGYISTILLLIMVMTSLGAELISSSRPLILKYNGSWYTPLFKSYSDKEFGGIFETEADYHDPDTQKILSTDENWAVWPVNRWDYKTINPNPQLQHPSPPSMENFLGTDDRGRKPRERVRLSTLQGDKKCGHAENWRASRWSRRLQACLPSCAATRSAG